MNKNAKNQEMDNIVSLAKRRGFIYPGSDIYGDSVEPGITAHWVFL